MKMVMSRVDRASIEEHLKEIVTFVEGEQTSIDAAFEKLLIAITNVLKLIDGQQGTLSSLQGTPKELQRYLIDLVIQIRKMTSQTNESLLERTNALLASLE